MPDRGSALARCGRGTHDPLLGSTRCAGGIADRGAPRPPFTLPDGPRLPLRSDLRPYRPPPMNMTPASAVRRRASLPMYDLPELRPAHTPLGSAIGEHRARGGLAAIPALLPFDGDPADLWQ